ncbi:MAG TPA: hypothetical protein PKY81_07510 [bacterium]|nr:hypothetical protein [bacterium]HPN30788.1 hypothetical protein [bacterium]
MNTTNNEVEYIKYNDDIIAIIIPASFEKPGLHFFSPNSFSQQLAYMRHPENYKICPHIHNLQFREINFTLETLFIRKGKVKIDFFNENKEFITDRVLSSGDVILLASGGHGFTFIEPTDIIEVKQGPYVEGCDKIKF